jgi:hypothetical protein
MTTETQSSASDTPVAEEVAATTPVTEEVAAPVTKDVADAAPVTKDVADAAPVTKDVADAAPITKDVADAALATEGSAPEKVRSQSALVFRTLPTRQTVNPGWWLLAVAAVGVAAWLTVTVARGTHFTTGQRAAAAWTSLLVVVALAIVAQVILLWYQSGLPGMPGATPDQRTLAYRRRGLKAAVIGQDGRASTSKTQVALWTAALVWALVDLLLLARAYHSGTLFTNAVTSNWHPEYLVLLGLPVAAATAAKAAVASVNSGQGPATSDNASDMAATLNAGVYVRDPVGKGVWGFLAGVAELFTGDDDAVAWADLQYVVFTLITLAYFASQFLAQPTAGLPPVPAALLTLMGVSATGYTANKIVSTKVNTKQASPAGQ